MPSLFFNFDEIKSKVSCQDVARDLYGCKIVNGFTACLWRGGDNPKNGHVLKNKFYDFKEKKGGGVFQLLAFKFSNPQDAQEWVGKKYGLVPRIKKKPLPLDDNHQSRYDKLISDGYHEVARYHFRNGDGTVVHLKVRLEKEGAKKEFVQGIPDGDGIRWSVRGVDFVLYRLPELISTDWVCIVEGEKSADCIAALGLPVTTTTNGAGHWNESYTATLSGKRVAIFPDNDAVGLAHAEHVAAALHGHAASVKVIPPQLPDVPKSGIDDWTLDGFPPKEAQDILDLVSRTREWTPPISGNSGEVITDADLSAAKQSNSIPFRNFTEKEGAKIVRGKEVKEITKEPRCQNDIIADLQRRFLGFPRLDGGSLFDHDRDHKRIIKLSKSADLIAWIDRKSKHPVGWARGDSFPTKEEFLASLYATARRYEGISYTPDWPPRDDLFYAHDPLPPASPTHDRFNHMVSLFHPATPADRNLIAAFIAAPIWHIPGIPRPSWIIDSQDGAGSGKTVLVELVAKLYNSCPIRTNQEEIKHDTQELIKRLLSSDGRTGRIVLCDNVTGDFRSPGLSDLITTPFISGRSPYGRGEEKRPNNLLYVLTANSAQVDSDIAIRSFYIMLKKPAYSSRWLKASQEFIESHRMEILADIIDLLSHHDAFSNTTATRFPEFEQQVLQAVCRTPEVYADVVSRIQASRDESNIDEEIAVSIREVFNQKIADLGIDPTAPVFIRSEVINSWAGKPIRDIQEWKPKPIQLVRNLAKTRHLPEIDPTISRWPKSYAKTRYSGLPWGMKPYFEGMVNIVHMGPNGEIRTSVE